MRINLPAATPLALLAVCFAGCAATPTPSVSGDAATPASTATQPASPPPQAPAIATPPTETAWPGIRLDRERRWVDLDAAVVLREGDWLELIACSPGTREHEAIVAVAARPSHIHLALLSLGLEPGRPIQSRLDAGQITVVPPSGPEIEVFFIYTRDGRELETPAHEWVVDRAQNRPMDPPRFLFTGSAFVEYEGRQVYMADLEGSVVSLVNFGDDLVTRDATQTNQTDNAQWGARTEAIPPLGTPLTLRLRPAKNP